jgi:hypothetical protein
VDQHYDRLAEYCADSAKSNFPAGSGINLSNQIWIHVPLERADKDKIQMTTVQSVIEKKSMVNLVRRLA